MAHYNGCLCRCWNIGYNNKHYNRLQLSCKDSQTHPGEVHAQKKKTYFSRAFVFDGELALLFAVVDVTQLVVKQIRGRRGREPGEKNREQGGERAAHGATEPGHLREPGERNGESAFSPHWATCNGSAASARILSVCCSSDLLLLVASRASSSPSSTHAHTRRSSLNSTCRAALHCSE